MAKENNTNGHTAATVTVPEQIVIGEQTFTVKDHPELEAFMRTVATAAAQTEKTKLYGTINGLQTEVKEKDRELNTLRLSQQAVQHLDTPHSVTPGAPVPYQTSAMAQMKAAIKDENRKGELTREDVAEMIGNTFNESMPKLLKQYMDPISSKLERVEQETTADYRLGRLKELGDAVIPEMVTGRNKEEIESSIILASQARARYNVQPTVATPPANTPPTIQQPIVTTPAPAVTPIENPPRMTTPFQVPEKNVRGMSQSDFAKERESLMANLKGEVSAYPQISNANEQ